MPEVGQIINIKKDGVKRPILHRAILRHTTISFAAKSLYILLADFIGSRSYCWPKQTTLATQLGGIGERSVRDYINELVQHGFIEVRHTIRINHYALLWNNYLITELTRGSDPAEDPDTAQPEEPIQWQDSSDSDRQLVAGSNRQGSADSMNLPIMNSPIMNPLNTTHNTLPPYPPQDENQNSPPEKPEVGPELRIDRYLYEQAQARHLRLARFSEKERVSLIEADSPELREKCVEAIETSELDGKALREQIVRVAGIPWRSGVNGSNSRTGMRRTSRMGQGGGYHPARSYPQRRTDSERQADVDRLKEMMWRAVAEAAAEDEAKKRASARVH